MRKDQSSRDSDLQLLFVYGSLKRGLNNHQRMGGCHWCGKGELRGLELYDLGPFPMAVASGAADAVIHGELYAVSPQQLQELDHFEGAPRLYERQRHQLSDGRSVWVYVGRARQVRQVARIASGVWSGDRRRQPGLAARATGLLGATLSLGLCTPGHAGDLRHDCLAWSQSHGAEQVAIANRIGREQLLTKAVRLAEEHPDDRTSLYRWSDIQQLCRRQ